MILVAIFAAAGCVWTTKQTLPAQPIKTAEPTQTINPPADGEKAREISYIYTTKRAFALVFSGMAEKGKMEAILDELDKYKMKALFFFSAMRVAEEPDIAEEILQRGHEIGNEGLTETDLTKLNYNEVYESIHKCNTVIEERTGVRPQYLWNMGGKHNDNILMAAKANGLDFVKYTIDLQSWEHKSAGEIQSYLENKITRGGVIALETEDLDLSIDTIDIIAKVSAEMQYSVQPLDYLLANSYEKKPLEEIPGWDAAKINPDYQEAQYNLVYNGLPDKKVLVLTFDDWGGDYAVTRLLDILDEYNVKATFFLRGDGVAANPNLAKAIAEDGMDVGNHTYSHPNTTEITPEEIQKEVVSCHQALTEAIQEQPSLLFRPPYGEVNDTTAKAIAATGYKDIIRYNVTTYDWDTNNKAQQITDSVKQRATNGSIVLFHLMIQLDTYKALPQIIEYYQGLGYTFMTASELVASGDADILTSVPSEAPEDEETAAAAGE